MPNEEEDVKETFAYFGAAMYQAQVLELTLANFLTTVHGSPMRDIWDFDHDLREHLDSTLGEMFKKLKDLVAPDELLLKLESALQKRNWLAHNYFRERASQFVNARGREAMKRELSQIEKQFEDVHGQLSFSTQKWLENRGVCDIGMLIELEKRKMIECNSGFETVERLPKEIIIIGIYRWKERGVILKTKDGRHLVLSDHGFSFGPKDILEEELVLFPTLEHVFPTKVFLKKIKVIRPWSYSIKFENNFELWVEPREPNQGEGYKFGIRKQKGK
jgi:hypothetical protein